MGDAGFERRCTQPDWRARTPWQTPLGRRRLPGSWLGIWFGGTGYGPAANGLEHVPPVTRGSLRDGLGNVGTEPSGPAKLNAEVRSLDSNLIKRLSKS